MNGEPTENRRVSDELCTLKWTEYEYEYVFIPVFNWNGIS